MDRSGWPRSWTREYERYAQRSTAPTRPTAPSPSNSSPAKKLPSPFLPSGLEANQTRGNRQINNKSTHSDAAPYPGRPGRPGLPCDAVCTVTKLCSYLWSSKLSPSPFLLSLSWFDQRVVGRGGQCRFFAGLRVGRASIISPLHYSTRTRLHQHHPFLRGFEPYSIHSCGYALYVTHRTS